MVFNENKLKSTVSAIAKNEGIHNPKIEITADEKGKGFLGEIILVDVQDAETSKRLSVVAKFAIKDEKIRKIGNVVQAYNNEIQFYTNIVPKLEEVQKLSLVHVPLAIPKFYHASSVPGDEFLILENINKQGFQMLRMQQQLDHDHLSLILEKYAQFHGLSLAFKTFQPEEFDRLTSKLHHHYKNLFKTHGGKLVELYQTVYDSLDDADSQPEKETIKKIIDHSDEISSTIIAGADDDFITLLHGDCWSNNNMFKYEIIEGKKKLVDVKIFDWQACYKGSPVLDISYIIYSGASKEILDNLEKYLKIYHQHLSNVLTNFNLDSDQIYSFEQFIKQWKKYSVLGALMGGFIFKLKYSKQEDMETLLENAEKYEETSNQFSKVGGTDGFNERIKDLFRHLYDNKTFDSYQK